MSFWKKKKNKKKKAQAASDAAQVTKTILELKNHQSIISKKVTHLTKQIEKYNAEARQYLKSKNRKAALNKIRLRKQVEKRVETLENQSMNLELQIMTLDETAFNKLMMSTMKSTNEAMKAAMKGITVEDVDELQADIQETIELNQELNEVFARPLLNDFDDDELLAELDDLLEEDNENALFASQTYQNLNHQLQQTTIKTSAIEVIHDDSRRTIVEIEEAKEEEEEEDGEDEELRKLELEMNMIVMSPAPTPTDLRVTGIAVR
jgi:charged multivesicular body protein 4